MGDLALCPVVIRRSNLLSDELATDASVEPPSQSLAVHFDELAIEGLSYAGNAHPMLDQQFADEFARDWIDSWNAHALDRILAHYADDFEMSSPMIAQVVGAPDGRLEGKAVVRTYWKKALEQVPDLRFCLSACFVGVDSVVLCYESSLGRQAAEVLFFDSRKLVWRAFAHYI